MTFSDPKLQLGPSLIVCLHFLTQVDITQIPSMNDFIGAQADLRKIVKIGEGTYGEAFKHNK